MQIKRRFLGLHGKKAEALAASKDDEVQER
jgi:hypothetical protein